MADVMCDGNGDCFRVDAELQRMRVSHAALLAACKEFVRKCESGEASSRRSYAQMKAALKLAEVTHDA